jgi:hypothetical protein
MKPLALVLLLSGVIGCGVEPTTSSSAPSAVAAARTELQALRARFPQAPLVPLADQEPRAVVALPSAADGEVRVEDPRSSVAVAFRLEGAPAAERVEVDGVSVYRGAGVVHRVGSDGLEDSLVFESRPPRETSTA